MLYISDINNNLNISKNYTSIGPEQLFIAQADTRTEPQKNAGKNLDALRNIIQTKILDKAVIDGKVVNAMKDSHVFESNFTPLEKRTFDQIAHQLKSKNINITTRQLQALLINISGAQFYYDRWIKEGDNSDAYIAFDTNLQAVSRDLKKLGIHK